MLMRDPKLLLNNNFAGKTEDIYLFIGKHPHAAFGNSTGDQQMPEYTQAGGGASLEMLVLHDDATREYAYGRAQGLPDSKFGTFTQILRGLQTGASAERSQAAGGMAAAQVATRCKPQRSAVTRIFGRWASTHHRGGSTWCGSIRISRYEMPSGSMSVKPCGVSAGMMTMSPDPMR